MIDVGWPDKDDFPYWALIRIRYSHEIDLVALEHLQKAICRCAPAEQAHEVATELTRVASRIAAKAVQSLEPIRSDQAIRRLEKLTSSLESSAMGQWDDDFCGTRPPWWWRWPWPGPWPWSEMKDLLKEIIRVEEARLTSPEGSRSPAGPEFATVELVRVLVTGIALVRDTLAGENIPAVEEILTRQLRSLTG